jgi:glucosylceramidase
MPPSVKTGPRLVIRPHQRRQAIEGLGGSLTESSAYVLASLEPRQRQKILRDYFDPTQPQGAAYAMSRVPIGSCDFSVGGRYSYHDAPDPELSQFSIEQDRRGFSRADHPQVRDESYDLLPLIEEVLRLNPDLKIVASAWSAPPWMKENEDWFGGSLRPDHYGTYASYLLRYLEAYAQAGVPIWGLTPVNEPLGNGNNWESMLFTKESMNRFLQHHLGPQLAQSRFASTKLLIFDQNREEVAAWAETILGDRATAPYVWGSAIHWYRSTVHVFPEELEKVHRAFPDRPVINTEATIDALGDDEEKFSWWQNDNFWWEASATDWGYRWAKAANKHLHPRYVPAFRYARNIIVSLNHWVAGWIDWNIVLDREGGPNHVDNFCGAPIMVDGQTGAVYYTPIYHILQQFSRHIRPGDQVIDLEQHNPGMGSDAWHVLATTNQAGKVVLHSLNTTARPIDYQVEIEGQFARLILPPRTVQTVVLTPQ